MLRPENLPITEEDWNKTPPAVQAWIRILWERVSALEAEISAMKEQVGQNSKNSSLPPSSDPPSVEKRKRLPSGRKPGGQPGHQGVSRPL